jgi:glycosyltransferase involved in cell wall biosynthesis
MKEPLISIIIPTFNRAHLLFETIESVLTQSYTNWECFIVDDFSTDKTKDFLINIKKIDKRFNYYIKTSDDKKGASASRNIGLQKIKGDYIQFLDSDDILAKNKLSEQLKTLGTTLNFDLATCKWEYFTDVKKDIEVFKENIFYKNFNTIREYFNLVGEYGGFFPLHCFLISKKIFQKSGFWNESLTLNDDGEFIFRILINSEKIIFCPKTYVLYRINFANSLSSQKSFYSIESLLISWKIIEQLYILKYNNCDSNYIRNKKNSIYIEIKRTFPKMIYENKTFFKKQIKADTVLKRFSKFYLRILKRLTK